MTSTTTNPIMLRDAERATKSPAYAVKPRMRLIDGFDTPWIVLRVEADGTALGWDERHGCVDTIPRGALPDLDDAATLGWLRFLGVTIEAAR